MDSPRARFPARIALACLFSALCCAGSFISIPIGPIPLVLANLFVVLGGALLGPVFGAAAAILYLAIGALGFPVFSGGGGGLAHFLGPTGGYLLGYAVAPILTGLMTINRIKVISVIGSFLGFASILALGAFCLKYTARIPWARVLAIGIAPFLIGDSIKAVIVAVLAVRLGPFVDYLTGRGNGRK